MAMKKITRRWLVNGLGVIFVILLGVMIAFSFGVRSFYYSSVQQIIISRSSVISTLLQTYAQDSSVNFSQELQNIVETFEYRETMELMAIDSSGKVMMTSSGFLPEEDLPMPDFEGAMSSPDGIDVYQGRIGGENIMAVSVAAGSASENLPPPDMWSRWNRWTTRSAGSPPSSVRCVWQSFCLLSSPAPTSSTPSSIR